MIDIQRRRQQGIVASFFFTKAPHSFLTKVHLLMIIKNVFKFRWYFFILICFLTTQSNAQDNRPIDKSIIYLKNGSIYIGDIIEEDDDKIKMEINDSEMTIYRSEIKRMLYAEDILLYQNGKFHMLSGFYGSMSSSSAIDGDGFSSHIEMLLNYRINDRLSVGVNVGFENNEVIISGFDIDTQFTSIGINAKYYITNTRKRIFLYSRLAQGISELTDGRDVHTNGINIQNGIGVTFSSRKMSKFQLALGFFSQKTEGTQYSEDVLGQEIKIDYDIWIARPLLKIGFVLR